MSKIEIKQLCKIYNEGRANEFRALKNISLSVEEGQIVILKGVSGSGKSTLLSMNPQIILADEPTANLDKQNSLGFIEMLSKLKELKKTVLIATHDILFDELSFVDRYVFLKDGEISA